MNLLQAKISDELNDDTGAERNRRELLNYYKIYGLDKFVKENYTKFFHTLPCVMIVCVDCDEQYIQKFIKTQTYPSFEILKVDPEDSWHGVVKKIDNTNIEYVAFLENRHRYDENKILDFVFSMETSQADVSICYRNFLIDEETEIKDITYDYAGNLKNKVFKGTDLLSICIDNRLNLYGNLSTVMIRKTIIKSLLEDPELVHLKADTEYGRMKLLYEGISFGNVLFVDKVYVWKMLQKVDSVDFRTCSERYLKDMGEFALKKGIFLHDLEKNPSYQKKKYKNIKKEITFFYTDKGEYYNLKPIAEEAEKRGYYVKFTGDIFDQAEIGVYCQHVCYPENAKFSVILLHDMAQRHDIWPNIWKHEHWDKFDVGILPAQTWMDRWEDCASLGYVRPRIGAFALGYPKADSILSKEVIEKASAIKTKFHYDFTVLYAPSWENDNKEDDFVRLLQDLPINLVVKQPHCPELPFVMENIAKMRILHDGKYNNLTYIDFEENILVALSLCDLVVSDESSVMTEATLYGKPSIAVLDWLIPDCTPSRFSSVPIDYVRKCKKNGLRSLVIRMIEDKEYYEESKRMGMDFFINKGNCCKDIMDLIEDAINNRELSERIKKKKAEPVYEIMDMWT